MTKIRNELEDSKERLNYLNKKLKLSTREKIEKKALEQILKPKEEYQNIEKYFNIVEVSMNKIYNTAKKSGNKAIQPELKEELYQIGMISLLETWNRFDKTKEASFRTYAFYRVRGAMLDFLRSQDTVSRSTRTALKLITHNSDNNTFTSKTLTREQIDAAVKKSTTICQFGLTTEAGTDTNSDMIPIANFADTVDTYKEFENKETLQTLFKICSLTDREYKIIYDHYFLDKNLYEIGEELSITESRISQLHKACLAKLAKYI
jgi:RNA polymerase sigma factor FliA